MKIHDIKLAAFLKLMKPENFQGIEREQHNRVAFIFDEDNELEQLASGFMRGEQFTFSPQLYGSQLDTCKNLIFQRQF